jgi:hypothetical protein
MNLLDEISKMLWLIAASAAGLGALVVVVLYWLLN